MEWDLVVATEYITLNTLDNEDFIDGDTTRKTALLNVASRTLTRKFSGLTIPNEAVYLFGAVLASAYNDTNKLQQQGVAGFSIKGISFTFKDWAKKGLDALVPTEVIDLINEANDVEVSAGRAVKWTTL
jgi:hypothetical protein